MVNDVLITKINKAIFFLSLTIFLFCLQENFISAEINTNFDKIKNFDYTGREQTFTAPVAGYYRLETWGAQGGSSAGFGAYATGVVYLDKGQTIYVNVGESPGKRYAGGYNGGGTGGNAETTNKTREDQS